MDKECHVDAIHKAPSVEERRQQATAVLAVQGMGCPNCAQRVRNGVLQVYGVLSVEIDLESGRAAVVYNPGLATPADLRQAVAAAGRDGRHEYRAYFIS